MSDGAGVGRGLCVAAAIALASAAGPGCSLVLESYHYRDGATAPDATPDDDAADDVLLSDVVAAMDGLPIPVDAGPTDDVVADAIGTTDVAPTDDAGAVDGWHVPPGLPHVTDALLAVFAPQRGEVYAGGRAARMIHYAAGAWTLEPLPPVAGLDGRTPATLDVRGLWGDPTSTWAACSDANTAAGFGAVLRRGAIEGAWRVFARVPFRPRGIYVGYPDASSGLLVAEDGAVYGFDVGAPGVVLRVLDTGVRPLNAVWGRSAEAVWFVGASSTALRLERGYFPLASVPGVADGDSLEDVSLNPGEPFHRAVVSDRGALAVFERGGWAFIPPDAIGRALHGVFVADGGAIYGVGDAGTIVHAAFAPPGDLPGSARYYWFDPSPTMQTLRDVHGTAEDDVWAVGEAGTVIHRGTE